MSSDPPPASYHQRALTLAGDLLGEIGRNLDAWTMDGDRAAGLVARDDADVVGRYVREIHVWLVTSLVLNDPQYRPADPVPEQIIESDRGPGG